MKKIVFATNNAHKLQELRQILGSTYEVVSLADIDCHEDIPETGNTLDENALQKANFVVARYNITCFADDTGLEVEALNGAPGVYTARYSMLEERGERREESKSERGERREERFPGETVSERNMAKLLYNLKGKENRRARFRTVIALMEKQDDETFITHTFEGIVNGSIAEHKSGTEGFGYDPIFVPEGYNVTFAELGNDIKNTISHRARAVAKLAEYLKTKEK